MLTYVTMFGLLWCPERRLRTLTAAQSAFHCHSLHCFGNESFPRLPELSLRLTVSRQDWQLSRDYQAVPHRNLELLISPVRKHGHLWNLWPIKSWKASSAHCGPLDLANPLWNFGGQREWLSDPWEFLRYLLSILVLPKRETEENKVANIAIFQHQRLSQAEVRAAF